MSDGNLETYETVKVREHSFFFLFCLSDGVQHLHKILPAFTPYVPVGVLAYLAFILLTATFGLAFYFTTYVVVVSIFYHRPIFFGSQHLEINHPYARGGSCYRSQHTRWLWHCSSLLFCWGICVAKPSICQFGEGAIARMFGTRVQLFIRQPCLQLTH